MLFQHFVLEGSQSRLEDSRSGSFPRLLDFSPIGEREKPVCHVDDVEIEMRYPSQWDKHFCSMLQWAVKETILLNITQYNTI